MKIRYRVHYYEDGLREAVDGFEAEAETFTEGLRKAVEAASLLWPTNLIYVEATSWKEEA